jgi:hypothetical protein
MVELARTLRRERPDLLSRLEYYGMDVDPKVLELARELTHGCRMRMARYHLGDALAANDYPRVRFHIIISTGLGEFLTTNEVLTFYANVYNVLEAGGTFYTSATDRDWRTDVLLRMAELVAHYRSAEELEGLLRELPWARLTLTRDSTGLQTFATAIK